MPAPVSSFAPQPENTATGPLAETLEQARGGAVIVTSNDRAARFLLREFNRSASATGASAWATAAILTWNAWLAREWQRLTVEFADAPLLLTSAQEHALWMQVLAAFSVPNPYALDDLADLAQKAWALLHGHRMDLAAVRRAAHTRVDWEQFSKWAAMLQARLIKEEWLTQPALAGELHRRLAAGQWRPPGKFVAWGFDFFTPSQELLLANMEQVGNVIRVMPSGRACSTASLMAGSRGEEFAAAARWAKLRLRENSAARLAIVTTQAAEDRGGLQRALSLEIAPAQFAFALGHPLAAYSLVRTALLLLEFQRGWLTAADVSDLLLAPGLAASDEERDERALFEANVFRRRDVADPAMDLAAFTSWLRAAAPLEPASLRKLVRQCQSALRLLPRKTAMMSAADWCELFAQSLAAFGYPANVLNSAEFQTWERWQQVLQAFAASAISGEKLTHAAALARLGHMTTEIFQPETGEAPIEILGPLEAAGSLFDGIFFLGCTDDGWPLPSVTNPLLPLTLQRAAGVPGAIAGVELERALKMTERILASSPEVLFSHAQRSKDGDLRPSPVIGKLHITPASEDLRSALLAAKMRRSPDLEQVDDTFGPAWHSPTPQSTSLLKSQAACPFQAFALYRLHARGEELPEEGLGAGQRGSLLHKALFEIWMGAEGLKTSGALLERLNSGTLHDFVKRCVDGALPAAADGWQREYFRIEAERLTGLISDWLTQIEVHRAPFAVVEAEKWQERALLPSLNFRVRPDRVDALIPPEGAAQARELVLLDYKTGKIESREWSTPRMDEPQLPFYALFVLAEAPAAIALGNIRGGEGPCVKAVAARDDIFPDSEAMKTAADDYQACLMDWRSDLESLAREFVMGRAVVAPKRDDTCKYCKLHPLCRVHESPARLDASSNGDRLAEESDG